MAKGNLLTGIQDQVFTAVRKAQFDFTKSDRGVHFHATDYVGECARNMYYSKAFPIKGNMDTNLMSIFWVGSAIHAACKISEEKKYNEFGMMYDIENNAAVLELGKVDGDRPFDYVSGTLDDLIPVKDGLKNEWCIVDKKTWRSKGWKKSSPSVDHVKQVNIYKVMLKAATGIDAKFGAITYFDMWQDGVNKPQVFPFELDPIEKTRAAIMLRKEEIKKANETGVLPKRTIHWKCNGYCPYAERCFSEEKVGKDLIKFVANV